MKKILLTLAGFMVTLLSIAQSPNLMNYQGVARNAAGNVLPNQNIALRLSILNGGPTGVGTVVYAETRTMLTNAFGLFNVVVGSPGATNVTGTIGGINWTAFGAGSGTKFLQVEIDPIGGSNFVNVGSTQLVSVPYALNAGSASPVGPAGGDLTGTYPNPTVAKIQGRAVSAAAPANKNLLMWDAGTVSWIPATAAQAGIVSGSGTLNYVPKWTPDGVTLGNSKIFDDGTFVGIGTTTPGAGLVVSGNGIWNSAIGIQNTGTGMEWRMNVSGTTFGITKIPGTTFTPLQLFSTGGMDFSSSTSTSIARLLDNGDVGIGTTAPVDRFHVVKGGNSGMVLGGGANTGSEAKFLSYGTAHISIYNRGNNALTFAQTSSLAQTNTLGAELMALTTGGDLGIGTIAPAGRVHSITTTNDAVIGTNNGTTGRGGTFQVTNATNVSDAIRAETNGSGASWGIRAISTGTNGAGLFQQTNTLNNANNIQSNQASAGTGRAGLFQNTNATNTANALEATTAGTGFALRAASTNAVPKALLTAGGVQLTGIGEAANRVLSSDAAGNATWNTLATVGGVSGSGTLNFLPKWTPNGTTIGNSQLFDDGTSIGLGTTSPNARFDIPNASTTTRGAFINNTDLTNNSSSLLIGRSNITGAGTIEGSALSAYLAPFVGTTWTLNTPVAAKSFASPNATVGFGGGAGFMGSSSSGVGVVGLTNNGTGVYGWALGGGYALQTDGKVQIIGQGAAAGKVLTSDAAGNATWQNLITPNVGIALRTVTGPTSFPVGTSDVTTWATVVHENGGANYDGAGGYTITVSGVYQINASMSFQPANPGFISIQTSVNGGTDNENAVTVAVVGQYMMPQLSYLRQLVAGDIVRVRINNGTGATQAPNTGFLANNFSLQLIHN